jgi:predicted CoA-binding protein
MTDAAPRFVQGYPERPADHNVVILGASAKPARYANMAQRRLMELGYRVIPVHPKIKEIEGLTVVHNLRAIADPVHTLTLYLGPHRSLALLDDIIHLNPRRVIFNPGTESDPLQSSLRRRHIPQVEGCTLVMLRTGQF